MKKYDVAISFAEEQRTIALAIAETLKRLNISTYYYPDELGDNVGTDMSINLPSIYEHQARFAIVLFSKKYIDKKWTGVEWDAVFRRYQKDKNYLIPIKVDEISLQRINGLSEDIVFVEWKNETETIVKILSSRLGKPKRSETGDAPTIFKTDIAGSVKNINQIQAEGDINISNN